MAMKHLLIVTLVLTLAACGGNKSSVRSALGINKSAPDEFKVVSRPPLSVPPEFRLRPPQPGAKPRGVATSEQQAESLLKTGDFDLNRNYDDLDNFMPEAETTVTPVVSGSLGSAADAAFLNNAGADMADDAIRDKLRQEVQTPTKETESDFAIHRWLGKSGEEEVVDPKAESERIRENIEDGKPVNEGDVKTIEEEPNTLDLLF